MPDVSITTSGTSLPDTSAYSLSQNGLLAESFPLECALGTGALTSGTKYVVKVPLVGTVTFTTVWLTLSAAGSTLTTGQNLISVYNSAGTQVGSTSADQTTPWSSSGVKTATVGSPGAQSGLVYVEILSVGTTPPTFRTSSQQLLFNANLSGANLRASTNGTGATAVDASLTPASLVATNAFSIWVGLS